MSSILTNNGAMVALQTLKGINASLAKTQDQISTGKDINNAKDDAAIWAISKVMESDVQGFESISSSLDLGSTTVGVARKASETVTDLLNQIKGKIVGAQEANVDKVKIQDDITALTKQIESVVGAAQFNGLNLVDGSRTGTLEVLSSLDRSGGDVKASKIGVDLTNAKMSINPFDEIAVEEAVRLKEAGIATEIIVVSIGVAKCQDTLRHALAIGADRGILVESGLELQPLAVAKVLKALCEQEKPALVLTGKQAIDDDANQTGQMLAALLGWPQATFASRVKVSGQAVQVMREIDGGVETVSLELPAVITTDLRLNEPRYTSLPNIMKARKKPIDTVSPETLGVDVSPRLKILKVVEPPRRNTGLMVKDVAELVARLKTAC